MTEPKPTATTIDRDFIRRRPGMFVGWTSNRGVRHLVWELVANSVDQVLAGRASTVQITIHEDESIEVIDNGPGLDLLSDEVRSYYQDFHSNPTADAHSPHVHLSHFGAGLAVVNALSTRFRVTTRFADKTIQCDWTEGGDRGGTPEILDVDWTGTATRVWPDPSIFDGVAIPPGALDNRIYELNALIPELHLTLVHEHAVPTWQLGLARLLQSHGATGIDFAEPLLMHTRDDSDPDSPIELRMGVTPAGHHRHEDQITAYCNFRPATEEGSFVHAIRSTIWRVAHEVIGGAVPPDSGTVPLSGLVVVASITMLSPEWGGPTKSRLDDPRSVAVAEALIADELPKLIDRSPRLQSALEMALRLNRPGSSSLH